ncbi:hypothetical protein IE53DRAFT_365799 [Violaceomyces palustris]|uniref:Uncharacterized protein n=1 Tax=Violaceomyces palustris TaxID=1673888 RepID=A0ACD0P7M7_9BASI|nr:hypothetical protein IE53DRAFT_365799 [Violaceomyces palustris]
MPRSRRVSSNPDSSVPRYNTYDDIPKDDQDLFQQARDEILLDGDDNQMDQDDSDDDFGGDAREILGVERAGSHDSSDDDQEEDEQGSEEGEQEYASRPPSKKSATSKAKQPQIQDDLSDDDQDDDDEDDDESDTHENDRGWGPNKRAYYNTNDLDDIESDSEIDEEQARELELKEVKRLQKKSRSTMDDNDFGLGDDLGEGDSLSQDAGRERRRKELDLDQPELSAATPLAAPKPSSQPASRAAMFAQVQKQSPEAIALAGEYLDVLDDFEKVDRKLRVASESGSESLMIEILHVQHQTLLTYLTAITFYFHLRAQPEYVADPSKLTTHPVMQRLVKLKQGLSIMDQVGLTDFGEDDVDAAGEGDEVDEFEDMATLMEKDKAGDDDGDYSDLGEMDEDELDLLIADEKENAAPAKSKKIKGKGKAVSNGKSDNVLQPKETKKSRKAKGSQIATVAPLADLADMEEEPLPEFAKVKKTKRSKANPFSMDGLDGDEGEASTSFGEPTQLSAMDSADKDARRKSLQFLASEIENKGARRGKAARERLGGDEDIPYRDRDRSRKAVEEAKARANQKNVETKDVSLDGEGWGEGDDRDWRDVMGVDQDGSFGEAVGEGDDDPEDYYDLVASGKKALKKAKKDEYEAMRDEERFVPEDSLEPGAHRGIDRTIEKNKGLTPYRPKSVRNPRVKKRQKYEKAKIRLGSQRAVFKGGQSTLQGGYQGEKSGISGHLIRSRKLG